MRAPHRSRPLARVLGSREEQPARTGPPRSCPACSPPPLPRPLRSWQEGFRLGASGCRACPVRGGAGSASRATPVRSSGCSRRPGGGDRGRSTGDPAESRRTASRGMCSGRIWGVGGRSFSFSFQATGTGEASAFPHGDKGPDGWFRPPGSEAQLGASPRFVRLQPARELGTQTQPSRNHPRGQQFADYTGIFFSTKPKSGDTCD